MFLCKKEKGKGIWTSCVYDTGGKPQPSPEPWHIASRVLGRGNTRRSLSKDAMPSFQKAWRNPDTSSQGRKESKKTLYTVLWATSQECGCVAVHERLSKEQELVLSQASSTSVEVHGAGLRDYVPWHINHLVPSTDCLGDTVTYG